MTHESSDHGEDSEFEARGVGDESSGVENAATGRYNLRDRSSLRRPARFNSP